MRSPSHFVRIKPIAFEYDRLKRFATMKCEFIDFFNYDIIIDPIKGCRTNARICGSSIGPTLLVSCRVKPISIHIISSKWPHPICKAIDNLSQLGKSIFCRVPHVRDSANNKGRHSAISTRSMCSARDKVCRVPRTWHSWIWHSANILFAECFYFTECFCYRSWQIACLPSVRVYALGKFCCTLRIPGFR